MPSLILRGLLIFVILLVVSGTFVEYIGKDFGTVDFFEKRGVFFLFFITLFPRLTLLFSSVVSAGIVWWLALIFCPRLLVAVLATVAYFQTNPILVVISWMVALSGEIFEKRMGLNRGFVVRYSTDRRAPREASKKGIDENTFEAEYKHK